LPCAFLLSAVGVVMMVPRACALPFREVLDSYLFNHKQEQFNKVQAASRSSMMLRMEASAL
jgi:hypothetical protein